MHGEKCKVARCIRLTPRLKSVDVFLIFECRSHCALALSLNGVKYLDRTIYATFDEPKSESTEEPQNKFREQRCVLYLCKTCPNHRRSCFHAHTLEDLRPTITPPFTRSALFISIEYLIMLKRKSAECGQRFENKFPKSPELVHLLQIFTIVKTKGTLSLN